MSQAFQLISGPLIDGILTDSSNGIADWMETYPEPPDLVAFLYQSVLSRDPSLEELGTMTRIWAQSENRRQVLEDMLWSLINSKEFVLRH